MKFENLNISTRIKKALSDMNYETLSPIQEQAMPAVFDENDVLGCAQTGTGKTCAFMLPIINKILTTTPRFKIRALILAPTRELAIQIHESTVKYCKYTNIRSIAIFGGVKEGYQKQKLNQGVDILIATPGRLIDFINQKVISLKQIEFFVLDEADRMLDMGFIKDINRIIEYIPKNRQTLLFSATMPNSIKDLCSKLLNDPVEVTVAPPSTTVEKIKQSIYYVDKVNKLNLLKDIILEQNMFSVLVFSRTKHGADKIAKFLQKEKILVDAIHGDKSQNARQKALKDFKCNKIQVLVATDIAARGIDIDFLSNVINYDIPETSETYVHRIGRTARAGREGEATSFSSYEEIALVKQIEKDCNVILEEIKHKYKMTNLTLTPKSDKNKKNKSFNKAGSKPNFKHSNKSNGKSDKPFSNKKNRNSDYRKRTN